MAGTGIVRSMKDFYWDLRPKPEYGTIELRVCDTPLSVERAAALACYLQALCRYLLEGNEAAPREDDYLVYNYNRFQACRFGLEGSLVHPQSHEQLGLRDDILATLRRLAPHARALGSSDALALLEHEVEANCDGGSDAAFLRTAFHEGGSREAIVHAALGRWRTDQGAPR
jgi:carboxylate-amine ligase